MAEGPGKYDRECTWVRAQTKGRLVVVMVVGGLKGTGFALQGEPEFIATLPAALRLMIDEIEADIKKGVLG